MHAVQVHRLLPGSSGWSCGGSRAVQPMQWPAIQSGREQSRSAGKRVPPRPLTSTKSKRAAPKSLLGRIACSGHLSGSLGGGSRCGKSCGRWVGKARSVGGATSLQQDASGSWRAVSKLSAPRSARQRPHSQHNQPHNMPATRRPAAAGSYLQDLRSRRAKPQLG